MKLWTRSELRRYLRDVRALRAGPKHHKRAKERERLRRQIERGQLTASNGLSAFRDAGERADWRVANNEELDELGDKEAS